MRDSDMHMCMLRNWKVILCVCHNKKPNLQFVCAVNNCIRCALQLFSHLLLPIY